MTKFNADINNAREGWVQVTISGDNAHLLTEEQIASSLSTLPIAVDGMNYNCPCQHPSQCDDSCLPSSPGKDGGQEVEAVAWQTFNEDQNRWAQCTEADAEAIKARGGSVRPLYTRPQPASTALVEKLTKALEPFAKEADKFDPVENDDHFLTWGTTFTIGDLRRARAALSASTSREGESR